MSKPRRDQWPDDGLIHLNGIDALTGQPLADPLSPEQAARLAKGSAPQGWAARWLGRLGQLVTRKFLRLPGEGPPVDLSPTGAAGAFTPATPYPAHAAPRPRR